MPPTRIICDKCGVETNEFRPDYDGVVYCVRCYLTSERDRLEDQWQCGRQSIRIREKNQTELRMKIGAINCQIDTLKPVQTPSEDR